MRLRPHLLAPLAAGAVLIGGAASAGAANTGFGPTIGRYCSTQTDLTPIDGQLTAAGTRKDLATLNGLEAEIAKAATAHGIPKKSSALYKTWESMEGELLLMSHVYGVAATALKSEQHLTKAQVKTLTEAYAPAVLPLSKQFKAIGANACNN